MGLYRDESGMVIEIDDRFAAARGYTPLSSLDEERIDAERGYGARADERGVVGSVNAAATGVASGLSLGLTDVALANTLTPFERERVQSEIDAHPYLRTGGEVVGALAGGLAAPGSALARTPAGYLSNIAAREVEQGLVQGGVRGVGKALGAMGAEGAVQSVGQYVGHSALADKETTAEGLAGSLGTGFAFGSLGGGAALGVVKGAMAGRRLWSRVMDGQKAAQTAESTWSRASQEAFDADSLTAQVAETKLETIRKAKTEAMRYRNEARAVTEEERIRASVAEPLPSRETGQVSETPLAAEGPEPLIDVGPQTGEGGATQAYKRPVNDREALQRTADAIPQPRGAETGAFKRPEGSTQRIVRGETDEGLPFKDIRKDSGDLFDAPTEGDIRGKIYEMKRQGRTKESMLADLEANRTAALSDIRFKATEDLLGSPMAKQERALQDAMDEYNLARKDVEGLAGYGPHTDGIPEAVAGGYTRVPKNAAPRVRQATDILDDAHEEALLRARHAADPQEAGQAITEAEELERLLGEISDGTPRHVDDTLADDIAKIQRYENASAKLADELGEQAHPVSVGKTKALRDAEKEATRKMYDRATRSIDDAETFGPTYKNPKERVAYARERQNDAQRNLDELGVQEKEAANEYQKANKKATAGAKAKKAAERADAKATGKIGAQDVGGIFEILDLPGLPKPSDLPVVGPLLGAYLKFRTLKRAMGRMGGRIPATADNRVAALASQTRDRVARAVDRSLGLLERGGKYASRKIPATAGILSSRIFDDGEENPRTGAAIPELAAARLREIAAYVHTPGAIERDVREQLLGVSDPDLIAAAEKHRRVMFEHLLKNAPKVPEQGILNKMKWQPSPAQAMSFARRLEAVSDPAGVWERVAHEHGMLSLEAAEAMREVYPQLFAQAQQRVMERAAEPGAKVPYRQRVQMTLLYKVPLDSALDPDNLKITQSVYERKTPIPVPGAPAPPSPSVANPVDMSQALTPSMDRR